MADPTISPHGFLIFEGATIPWNAEAGTVADPRSEVGRRFAAWVASEQDAGRTGTPAVEVPTIAPGEVDAECDRRTQTMFVFAGVAYQLTERALTRITALGADARFAALAGAAPGNLRWADPDNDFGWIATDNSVTPMDAQTMAAFADAAKVWVSRNTFAARALKDMTPIPADFNADTHWPAGS